MDFLPGDFAPGEHDVICSRGKDCFDHMGNKAFRRRVEGDIEKYMMATDRQAKHNIVSSIIRDVENNKRSGGFVRKDVLTGQWYRVNEKEKRFKVAQALRDGIKVIRARRGVPSRRQRHPGDSAPGPFMVRSLQDMTQIVFHDPCRPSGSDLDDHLVNDQPYRQQMAPTLSSMGITTSNWEAEAHCSDWVGSMAAPQNVLETAPLFFDESQVKSLYSYDVDIGSVPPPSFPARDHFGASTWQRRDGTPVPFAPSDLQKVHPDLPRSLKCLDGYSLRQLLLDLEPNPI